MDNTAEKSDIQHSQKGFYVFVFGFFLNSAAYTSVLNLQSSINIVDGLGTISVAVTYLVCNVFSILFSPMMLKTFGAKKCLVFSEVTYMLYVVANFYPEFYTLVPAAVLLGIGEGMLWIAASLWNVYYATQFSTARQHPTKDKNFYVNLLSGYFFAAVQVCQIFGNLISYGVLYGFDTSSPNDVEKNTTVATPTTTDVETNQYQFCGAQDCQDQDTVGNTINQYVPTNRLAIIILMSILTVLCLIGQILHCYILPSNAIHIEDIVGEDPVSKGNENPAFDDEHFSSSSTNEYSEDQLDKIDKPAEELKQFSFWKEYQKALKETAIQFKDLRQVLLVPMSLYVGFFEAFVFSELTRAYSSCVMGVHTVGLCMATFGFSDAVLSWVVGKLADKWGRAPFFIASGLLDIGTFSYCLFWNPNPEDAWSIYLSFFALGVTDGVWQTLLNVAYLEYFHSNQVVALSAWNFWVTVGFTVQYGWSTSLCVYVKLYVQLSLLFAGMICYAFAERMDQYQRKQELVLEGTRL